MFKIFIGAPFNVVLLKGALQSFVINYTDEVKQHSKSNPIVTTIMIKYQQYSVTWDKMINFEV